MATPPAAAESSGEAAGARRLRTARRGGLPWTSAVAVPTIVAAAVLMFLRPVFNLGFYYDDWRLLGAVRDASGQGWADRFAACREIDPAGRFGGCLYHSIANFALGENASAYHVLSIALLAICAVLLYALLCQCRLGHWPALLTCVLFVIYPGSDSTRLWPTGLAAQYVLGAYIGAVLLGIAGLRRTRARALTLHAASLGVFVLLLFTYEVVLPLIAVAAMFYLVAVPADRKAAMVRGSVDLLLALAFTAFRLFIEPVRGDSGFVQGRTVDQWITRVEVVLKGAWASWRPLFLPGTAAMIVALVAALVWITAMAKGHEVRRASVRWMMAAVTATVFAILSVLPFVVANDLYVPDSDSLFNRLNLAAAPAYCVLFVALCGLLWTALAHWLPRAAATTVVSVLVVGVAAGQVAHELRSQEAWATSWTEQTAALHKLRMLAPRLDRNASVMSFGHPIWERGFIPVFAASWDLRGAIEFETRVDPPAALPFVDDAKCGSTYVLLGSTPYLQYRGSSPLWFVNLANGQSRRITSSAQCQAAIMAWGRPPFWGKTITGG